MCIEQCVVIVIGIGMCCYFDLVFQVVGVDYCFDFDGIVGLGLCCVEVVWFGSLIGVCDYVVFDWFVDECVE